jgi:hypothetical protein
MLYRFSGDKKIPPDNTLKMRAMATKTEAIRIKRQSMAACFKDNIAVFTAELHYNPSLA